MPLDILRERAKAAWNEETKYFKDNAAAIQKSIDEDRDRQLKE